MLPVMSYEEKRNLKGKQNYLLSIENDITIS